MDHIFNVENGKPVDADFRPHAIIMLTSLHSTIIDMGLSFLASGIKIAKTMYLQQVANTKLMKERSQNETRIAKSRIQPAFLFRSLNTVYSNICKMEPDAPNQILRLSELLSYILYDCNENLILLKKELEMTRTLIDMEKMNYDNQYEFLFKTSGNIDSKSIQPLSLFSQIHQILQMSSGQKETRNIVAIVVTIEDDFISIPLPDNLMKKHNHEMNPVENFNTENRVALYHTPKKERR